MHILLYKGRNKSFKKGFHDDRSLKVVFHTLF